ncbi:MAG: hypothetical protein R3D33_18435 [Hyphomicrobiaceae bacterium]
MKSTIATVVACAFLAGFGAGIALADDQTAASDPMTEIVSTVDQILQAPFKLVEELTK